MPTLGQIEVSWNEEKNLIRMNFVGAIDAPLLKESIPSTQQALEKLRPHFTLLTDLTDMTSMDPLCIPVLRVSMDNFAKSGVKRIVRVIPNVSKDIGFNILSRFHYPQGIQIISCATLKEAERALS